MNVYSFIKMLKEINWDKENKLDYFSDMFKFILILRKNIEDLSKGKKQKLKLCSVLGFEKEIYFFDEPTSGLDHVSKKNLLNYIKNDLKGKFVIYISHDLEEIAEICEEVIILKDKEISNVLKIAEKDSINNLKGSQEIKFSCC